ncbi:sensor histidine kinase [Maricaulis virginensis]|uniref:Signal transduction histidine kinase internal region domain-containing protein n=1 Tax=Maricaulis virginensis TaxID=144022 RepID=A0A9W6MM07_9PROT|nr:histidine kinase [Maricaulis virginensis]GLK50533.1 hypothetical protein GCM10017621_00410 [Maricaulis virginensis]
MFDRLSKSALKIRVFGLVLSTLMALVQILAMLMLPQITGNPLNTNGLVTLGFGTVFGLVVSQIVLTFFLRHGIESIGAWLAAFAGMLAYGLFDTVVAAWIEQSSLLPLSRGLLIFGVRLTANVLWMYGVWLGVTLFLLSQHHVAEERQRVLMLERAQFETRLSFLESQINPHFLFNALNTVASLIVLERAPDARHAVIHLGHLLRRSLNGEGSPLATLNDEIDAAKAYLAIEKLRFSDRLNVDWFVEPGLGEVTLPRFSLQPLVENIVKHGVAHALAPVNARIRINSTPRGVMICIWNDGLPDAPRLADPKRHSGVGLRNLEQRLHLLFAGEASLEAGRPDAGTFECRLTLPFPVLREAAE